MYLQALSLTAFRNYDRLTLSDLSSDFVAFVGPNGAGKTNILEAISVLSPGRGLRNAEISEIQQRCHPGNREAVIRDLHQVYTAEGPGSPPLYPRHYMGGSRGGARDDTPPRPPPEAGGVKKIPPLIEGGQGGWAVHARVSGRYGPQDIGLGQDPVKNRRLVHLNGAPVKSQTDLAEVIRCVWLTPLQDRVFMDGASARRKLIDRWVFTADPAHAGRMTRLDRLLAERNRVLAMNRADPLWLDAVEHDLAATAIAIMTARMDYLDRLRHAVQRVNTSHFPTPDFRMTGFMEDRIGVIPAVTAEKYYADRLREARARDAAAEATTIGPHRVDIQVTYADKNMPAGACSTGEQKALLFALFLAHTRLIRDETGEAPMVLLDEITAHLDPARRAALFETLRDVGAQVFLTATTADQFSDIPSTQIFHVTDGVVRQEKDIQENPLSPHFAGRGLG